MGGFVQNLINGYLGLRIFDNHIEFLPYLVPGGSGYTIYGVSYQEMTFNFQVDASNVQVSLTSPPTSGCVLIDENGKLHPLAIGVVFTGPIKIKRQITCRTSSKHW